MGFLLLAAVFAPAAVAVAALVVAFREAAATREVVAALRRDLDVVRGELERLQARLQPVPPPEGASNDRDAGAPEASYQAPSVPTAAPERPWAEDQHRAESATPLAEPLPAAGPPPAAAGLAGEAASRSSVQPPAPGAGLRSLEAEIGSRWLLVAGAIVLVLGLGFFVKHAFENEWITPLMRVVAGAAAGSALVFAGSRFVRRGYTLYGQILTGGGIAVLYLSTYAAFAYYGLIGRTPAFVAMVVITAVAAALADRQRSAAIATMAVGGGFLTPFLVGGGADQQVTLFTYDAILVAGTMYLAKRRTWLGLNVLSFTFTVLTVAAWASVHYRPSKYAVTEAFLTLFCAMFVYILALTARSGRAGAAAASTVIAAGPVLYYFASLALLFAHPAPLMVFLVGLTGVGIWAGIYFGSPAIRLATWFLAVLPFFAWLPAHTGESWLTLSLPALVALHAMHLLAGREYLRRGGQPRAADVLLFHLNGLTLFLGAFAILTAVWPEPGAAVAAVLALWNLALWAIEWRGNRAAALHPLALAFALGAIAVALGLGGLWITVGWAAEGAAVVWVGLVTRQAWLRRGGSLLLALAVLRFLAFDEASIPIGFTPALNARVAAGAFIVALLYGLARLGRPSAGGREIDAAREPVLFLAVANLVTVWMITVEIAAYFRGGLDPGSRHQTARLVTAAAWALYGLGLVAAGERPQVRGKPLFTAGGLLLAILAVARLLSVELHGDTSRFVPVANPHFASGLVLAFSLYLMARLLRPGAPAVLAGHALRVAAAILGCIVLTAEVSIFWHAGAAMGSNLLAEQMSVSIAWALYAMVLIVIGIARRYAPVRILSMALFGLAVAKVFLFDLAYLAGIYRVAGFLAVGSLLLLASFLYQRMANEGRT